MSIPTDDVAVCNLALDHLKQVSIANIEDPETEVEDLMSRQFPQARRATLRMHPWNFASKRIALTPSTGAEPVVGYTRAFKKPVDFIRLLHRLDSDGQALRTEYDLEGDYLLMDGDANETIYIKYTFDQSDMGKWDPLAIDLLAVNLALRVSSKFSGSEARAKALRDLLIEIKGDARAIDGQERPPRLRERSAFLSARHGIGVGSRGRDQRYTYFN